MLRKIINWLGGATSTSTFSQQELFVISRILPDADTRSRNLNLQASQARNIVRKYYDKFHYAATVPYVENSDLLVLLDRDAVSPTIKFSLTNGGKLECTLHLKRGGFLYSIDCVVSSESGNIRDVSVLHDTRACHVNWIPGMIDEVLRNRIVHNLSIWLRIDDDSLLASAVIDIKMPVNSDSDGCLPKDSLFFTMPMQYRAFLKITDGMAIRYPGKSIIFNSLDQVTIVDKHMEQKWIIADLNEAGRILISNNQGGMCYFENADGGLCEIGVFRDLLCNVLIHQGSVDFFG